METSSLRFLKDYDIITILNEEVPKSREKFAIEFHSNLYNNKLNNNDNYFFKIHIDNTFWKINEKRVLSMNVSFIQPCYPFYTCPITKKLYVNHAIKVYEGYKNEVLPCGTLSTGAQCMCDICYDSINN
jgi:hypothetical protein